VIEWARKLCLSLPHATEEVLWTESLVFKVGGKMFAMMPLSPDRVRLSFKCTVEEFAELTEREGIIPAPYIARAHWIALESVDVLPRSEVMRLIRDSYHLVFARLTKKLQAELSKPVRAKSAGRR
jgi:predicted DNA-binding protein (MmcQ/YjbR family)